MGIRGRQKIREPEIAVSNRVKWGQFWDRAKGRAKNIWFIIAERERAGEILRYRPNYTSNTLFKARALGGIKKILLQNGITPLQAYGRIKTTQAMHEAMLSGEPHVVYGEDVGVRLVFEGKEKCKKAIAALENGLGKPLHENNRLENPAVHGYRAYHGIFPYKGRPIEVQIRTSEMEKDMKIIDYVLGKHSGKAKRRREDIKRLFGGAFGEYADRLSKGGKESSSRNPEKLSRSIKKQLSIIANREEAGARKAAARRKKEGGKTEEDKLERAVLGSRRQIMEYFPIVVIYLYGKGAIDKKTKHKMLDRFYKLKARE